MSNEQTLYLSGCEFLNKTPSILPSYDNKYYSVFFRGLFDDCGDINTHSIFKNTLVCEMNLRTIEIANNISSKLTDIYFIKCKIEAYFLTLTDYDALHFLNEIYKDSDARYRRSEHYDRYKYWLTFGLGTHNIPFCNFEKTEKIAIIPEKQNISIIGYHLSIVKFIKKIGKKTFIFDTCIKARPNLGYYLTIVPNNNLVKSGYILNNTSCVIQPTNEETIKIFLTRVDDSLPEIKLPFKCCKLIMNKNICYDIL